MSSGPVGDDPLFFAVGGRRWWPDRIFCQRRGGCQVSLTGETETAFQSGAAWGLVQKAKTYARCTRRKAYCAIDGVRSDPDGLDDPILNGQIHGQSGS